MNSVNAFDEAKGDDAGPGSSSRQQSVQQAKETMPGSSSRQQSVQHHVQHLMSPFQLDRLLVVLDCRCNVA